MALNTRSQFPKSLTMIGLSPGFTSHEFNGAMMFDRSQSIRNLAFQEWQEYQKPEYENSSYRWYLSYVMGDNSANKEFEYMFNRNSNK